MNEFNSPLHSNVLLVVAVELTLQAGGVPVEAVLWGCAASRGANATTRRVADPERRSLCGCAAASPFIRWAKTEAREAF